MRNHSMLWIIIFTVTLVMSIAQVSYSQKPFEPYMVKDLIPDGGDTSISEKTVIGDIMYMTVRLNAYGEELWKTDGTAEGTVIVKDIWPGPKSSNPKELTNVDGVLFFTADDGEHGFELWKSDGTPEGTVMVRDFAPGSLNSYIEEITSFQGKAFFRRGRDWSDTLVGRFNQELYCSDGTAEGTTIVKNINPNAEGGLPLGSYPEHFFVGGDTLYFIANDGTHGEELWRTDGTEAGTFMVKDIRPGGGGGFLDYWGGHYRENWAYANNLLFFTRDDLTEYGKEELWKSDGTDEGTSLVRVFQNSSVNRLWLITELGNQVLFKARDENGNCLWKSDGTQTGTTLIKYVSAYSDWVTIGDRVLFEGYIFLEPDSRGLWVTDGSEDGTQLALPGVEADFLSSFGERALFIRSGGKELWVTDGSEQGTYELFKSPYEPLGAPVAMSDKVFLHFDDGIHGRELWVTTDEPHTAEMVVDLNVSEGTTSHIDNIFVVRGALMFTACTQKLEEYSRIPNDCYNELWRSDGTPEGTTVVWSKKEQSPQQIKADSEALYFLSFEEPYYQLYRSYGTPETTVLVWQQDPTSSTDIDFDVIDGEAYLSIREWDYNPYTWSYTIWRSAGTAQSTEIIAEINGAGYRPVIGYDIAKYDGFLYFAWYDEAHGVELWKTNGTSEGTSLVYDINPTGSSYPEDLMVANDQLFFHANDGTHYREVWRSDGTSEGTYLLKDTGSYTSGGLTPQELTEFDKKLIFLNQDMVYGIWYDTMWISDGTSEGTSQVDLPFGEPLAFGPFTEFKANLFFRGWNENTRGELWKTDGTSSGTMLVENLASDTYDPLTTIIYGSSNPDNLVAADDLLFFKATTDDLGRRIYMTDGSVGGAMLIPSVCEYDAWGDCSYIWGLNYVDGLLFFLADDGVHGQELWAMQTKIIIDGCDTGITDKIYDGKLVSDWIEECAASAKNHGKFVSCVAHLTNDLKRAGFITGSEKGAIQSCAGQVDMPQWRGYEPFSLRGFQKRQG